MNHETIKTQFVPLMLRGAAIVHLTREKHALIDPEDLGSVSGCRWLATKCNGLWYAAKSSDSASTLHRWVMNAPRGMQVDHVNGITLDNRKHNLRLCSRRENQFNRGPSKRGTSRFKGVSWNTERSKWYAQIKRDGKITSLGKYQDEEEAARAYDSAAIQLFGEFARLNFPSSSSD